MTRLNALADRMLAKVLPSAGATAMCAPNESTTCTCGQGHVRKCTTCYTKTLSGGQCKRVCSTSYNGMC